MAGGITKKRQNNVLTTGIPFSTTNPMEYKLSYSYNSTKKHQLSAINFSYTNPQNQPQQVAEAYTYDLRGNVTQIANHPQHGTQEFIWDEADRLMAVKNNAGLHHYVYDHTGTRLLKGSYTESILNVNGRIIGSEYTPAPYTVYTGPHMVCTFYADAVDVTKHYYTGGQRIASKLYQTPYAMDCPGEAPNEPGEPSNKAEDPAPTINYIWCQQPVVRTTDIVLMAFKEYVLKQFLPAQLAANPQLPAAPGNTLGEISYQPCTELDWQNFNPEVEYEGGNLPYIDCLCRYNPQLALEKGINCQSYTQIYWYHPDYLGNTEFVTDAGGYPYQFFYYSAFGETLWQHDAQTGNFATPYKFNAKEQDTETGNYYYGARYYNPQTSIWFGVDPMAGKYPNQTPYCAMDNNPIYFNDPTGEDATVTIKSGNDIIISAKIYIYGSGASEAQALKSQTAIMNDWNKGGKGWTYTDNATGEIYNVRFSVSVELYNKDNPTDVPTVISDAWNPFSTNNYIEIGATKEDISRSYVQGGDAGKWRGYGSDASSHEFGHIIGLTDRYTDGKGVNLGWEGNIMGEAPGEGVVQQKNINSFVAPIINQYQKSEQYNFNKGSTNIFWQYNNKIDESSPGWESSGGDCFDECTK